MRHALAILLLVLVVDLPAQDKKLLRALPDDNLAYPVLITLRNGDSGSGFFVTSETDGYLVTAKHVLFNMNTGLLLDMAFEVLSYSRDVSDETPNVFTVDTTKLAANSIIKHPVADIVVVKVFTIDSKHPDLFGIPQGVTINKLAKLGIVGLSKGNIKNFADVLVGNQVFLFGYPTSLALQEMPEIDPRRPLLRKGIVAGKNLSTHSIILDCPAYFGNSGGPVIEVDEEGLTLRRFLVIGVVNKYVPYKDGGRTFAILANSGYSVITPMDYVLELIK